MSGLSILDTRYSIFKYRTYAGVSHQLRIALQIAGKLFRRNDTLLPALCDDILRNEQFDAAVRYINVYLVAVLDECNKSAFCSLGRNMTYRRSAARTAETAVCDEGNASVKPLSCDRSRRREHLRHSRSALRTLIADNHDIARLNAAVKDSVVSLLLAVEDFRSPGEVHHLRLDRSLSEHLSGGSPYRPRSLLLQDGHAGYR